MEIKDIIIFVLLIGIIISLNSAFTVSSLIDDYKNDLEDLKEDLRDYKDINNQYEGLLKNAEENINLLQKEIDEFECPECEDCDRNPIYDVNRDGIINFEDSTLILNYINHEIKYIENICYSEFGNAWELLYDVNYDGKVNLDDAQLVSNNMD
jgi:hypothetical protein